MPVGSMVPATWKVVPKKGMLSPTMTGISLPVIISFGPSGLMRFSK